MCLASTSGLTEDISCSVVTGLNGALGGSENRRLSGAGTAPVEKRQETLNEYSIPIQIFFSKIQRLI